MSDLSFSKKKEREREVLQKTRGFNWKDMYGNAENKMRAISKQNSLRFHSHLIYNELKRFQRRCVSKMNNYTARK